MADITRIEEQAAAVKANEDLGEAKDETGQRILGTIKGTRTLTNYEIAETEGVDPLTHLLNRREWKTQMEKFREVAIRSHGDFVIAMLDVDQFKRLNDTYGHPYGDEILEKFGNGVLERFRAGDICGRYGGDEAIVMLTTNPWHEAQLHEEGKKLSQTLTDKVGVGISVGLARWDGKESLEDVIRRADKNLYKQKEENR